MINVQHMLPVYCIINKQTDMSAREINDKHKKMNEKV